VTTATPAIEGSTRRRRGQIGLGFALLTGAIVIIAIVTQTRAAPVSRAAVGACA
jgi:uncharacterized protein (UPF0333 family)